VIQKGILLHHSTMANGSADVFMYTCQLLKDLSGANFVISPIIMNDVTEL
jgi:hypothetical protein